MSGDGIPSPAGNLNIREILDGAILRLRTASVETPRLDAELLLAQSLGRDRVYLFAHPEELLSPETAERYAALVNRRAGREPLPYLLGTWEFMGMPFRVSPAVLIPRPETETLVEAAAAGLPVDARILDVGTGSGCISAGLAKLLPRAEIVSLEPSAAARDIAKVNFQKLGYGSRIQLVAGYFPDAVLDLRDLDAIVSNPPYIPSAEVSQLEPELRLHEPRLALDGGADGLDVLRPLVKTGGKLLKAGGLLALEVAQGQSSAVCDLIRACPGWREPETVADLAGTPRVVLVRRQ